MIAKKSAVCGGKACIEGTRIRVSDIVERYKILKENPEEIAAAFGINVTQVLEALKYYYENQEEIAEEIKKDKSFIEKHKPILAHAA